MALPQHETTPHIEALNEEQSELFSRIGESIVKVSLGVESIRSTERIIARDKAFLEQFKPPYGEAIKPEDGKLFAVIFTEPREYTFFAPYFIDNGCRSGHSSEEYILEVEPSQEKPTVFLAASIYPYAYDFHGELLNGYQFNGLGSGLELTVDPNLRTGVIDGVEIGQVDYWQAEKLLSGEGNLAFLDQERVEQELNVLRETISQQEPQMSLGIKE